MKVFNDFKDDNSDRNSLTLASMFFCFKMRICGKTFLRLLCFSILFEKLHCCFSALNEIWLMPIFIYCIDTWWLSFLRQLLWHSGSTRDRGFESCRVLGFFFSFSVVLLEIGVNSIGATLLISLKQCLAKQLGRT